MPPDPSTSPILFGREPDLAYLLDRVQRSGVTAVAARAQMGKSALLNELAARLTQQPDGNLFRAPLIGITESLGETSDLLLRAVSSLYTRWIGSSTFREQGGVVAAQQNHDLVGRAGEVVGKLFKSLAGKPLAPLGDLVSDTLSGLATANRNLESGRLELPRLQTEQARDLLELVAHISGRPLVLIMDQWEKSPSPVFECNILDNFLRHIEDWPTLHIFLGVRAEKTPLDLLAKLRRSPLTPIEIFPLPDMHLDTQAAQRPLLDTLHSTLPFTATIPDAQVLDLLDGYPGTIARWLATNVPPPITTYARLAQLADDANNYRYPEFDTELRRLDKFRPLAMRVALLPYCATEGGYKKLRPEVLASASGVGLDELKTARILESSPPPSLGHAKRAEAALAWFLANAHEELYDVTQALIFSLAARLKGLTGDTRVFAGSLSALCSVARKLDLPPLAQALTQSAASIFQDSDLDSNSLTDPDLVSSANESVAPLLAVGLFNAANHQDLSPDNRDKLLDQLRQLEVAYASLTPIAEIRARALSNAFHDSALSDDVRGTRLYAELNGLAQANSGSIDIQESYSRATHERFLQAARQGDDPAATAALLDRLRKLAATYSSAPSIVLSFAMGLHNAMVSARNQPTPGYLETLLQELRSLQHAYPSDAAIAKQLALGLVLSLRQLHLPEPSAPVSATHTAAEQTASERSKAFYAAALTAGDSLLDEVRALHRAFEPDPDLGEVLALGLAYRVTSVTSENAFTIRQSCLAEIRSLILKYPSTRTIQVTQAQVVFFTISQTGGTPDGTTETLAPLLAEIRGLAEMNPDNPVILDLYRLLSS